MTRSSRRFLDDLRQDVHHALRDLRRAPGFTAAVIGTLGFGIGANAVMFGVLDRLMLRPFPYLHEPSTVHRVRLRYQSRGTERTLWDTEYARYLDLAWIYGVIDVNVTLRFHELGVRAALGAQPGDILGLVLAQGVRLALTGVAVGTVIALGPSRWLQPLLFEQSGTDPSVYGVVAGTLVLVALMASAAPALRATKADPNLALRSE